MKNFVFENKNFRLTVWENAIVESLISKRTGEELLMPNEKIALFSETQLRPFNNEVKLMYMNKRTTFQANSLSVDGNKITVGFEIVPWKAIVSFDVKDEYITFTLEEVLSKKSDLCTDLPPIEEFRILQLPIKDRKYFGSWLNAVWDDDICACVLATMPEALIDSERREGFRILTAEARKDIKLKGVSAAIIVSGGKEDFLCSLDRFERDYALFHGVESRRNPIINRSIYWTGSLNPTNVDEHIKYAKMGGFECMLVYYECMCNKTWSYGTCGDYSFNEKYPNGDKDMREVVAKIKAAGITPGLHFLHTHIGKCTKYITPVTDHRLNLTMHFTLAKPLGLDDDKIYVDENPHRAMMHEKRRVLNFAGELMTYEGFSAEPPYHFYGVKRGYWDTTVVEHPEGQIGGQLDISEYGAVSAYINQRTVLQDEIAEEIAKIYDCGFEFIYFDGSEGTQAPYEYHVPNAQYRVIKKLASVPLFCEGAAKAHFGWHHLSGANAFDMFTTPVFKRMIDKYPLVEAPLMAQNFTRVNFGWWAFYNDTRRDVYEYGTSRAFSWDCPVTMMESLVRFKSHARINDILEVMRRWEYVRKNNIISVEQKEMLKTPGQEHTLLINEERDYELVPYYAAVGTEGENPEWTAFVFERRGRSYALIWHNTGSARLSISIENAKYERELGSKALPVEKANGGIIVEISDSAYLSADIPMEELKEKLMEAKVV